MIDLILLVQGIYYFVTGAWPIIHLESFISVVGPKPDLFQLYTTSFLIILIGVVLLSAVRREKTRSIYILSIGSALAFIVVELIFMKRIRPVFWLELMVEAAFLIFMTYALTKKK